MKKILFIITGSALIFTACNNAEEVKKQQEEQAASIQTQVDEKLAGLSSVVDEECAATVDSLATEQFNEWVATEGKKKGVKPKPKAKPVVEIPKKEEVKDPQKQRAGEGVSVPDAQKERNSDPTKTPLENQKKRN